MPERVGFFRKLKIQMIIYLIDYEKMQREAPLFCLPTLPKNPNCLETIRIDAKRNGSCLTRYI